MGLDVESLYRRYGPQVLRRCRFLLRDEAQAVDAMHDVFVELLDGIPDSPSFGVNYDPSNAVIAGEDPIRLLEAVKFRVKTMHASDRYFEGGTWEDLRRLEAHPHTGYASILKHGVIGRGLNDYDRIFAILKNVGFNGWISIEDGPDPKTGLDDIAQSAVFLRKKMREHRLS